MGILHLITGTIYDANVYPVVEAFFTKVFVEDMCISNILGFILIIHSPVRKLF